MFHAANREKRRTDYCPIWNYLSWLDNNQWEKMPILKTRKITIRRPDVAKGGRHLPKARWLAVTRSGKWIPKCSFLCMVMIKWWCTCAIRRTDNREKRLSNRRQLPDGIMRRRHCRSQLWRPIPVPFPGWYQQDRLFQNRWHLHFTAMRAFLLEDRRLT